jgi:hypothetical protein
LRAALDEGRFAEFQVSFARDRARGVLESARQQAPLASVRKHPRDARRIGCCPPRHWVCVADVMVTLGTGTHEPSCSGRPPLSSAGHGEAAAIAWITAALPETSANTA